jgi:hypothetical protein
VNKDIVNNDDLLRQTLAHEIIHHHLYQQYGNQVARHGEHFSLLADRINQKEGENFVSEFADDTDFKPNTTTAVSAINKHMPKLLYHQTTKKNAEEIKSDGFISPRIGSIVQETYVDQYGDEATIEPVVFMSDNRKRLGFYSLWQMEHEADKTIKREDFTAEHLAENGALVLIDPQNENNSIYYKPKDFEGRYVIDVKTGEEVDSIDSYGNNVDVADLPVSIENGDYFSLEAVKVYRILTGQEYLDYLRKYSEHTIVKQILNKKAVVKSSLDLDIPEIIWSYPTDKELLNEVQTEFEIEKLFISEMWPKTSDYQLAVDHLKKVSEPEKLDPKKLKGRHIWKSLEDLIKTVKSFGGPKDPEAMLEAISFNKPLPMPIVIRKRNGEMHVAGGATRSGIANLAGQDITALVIDEKKANEMMADRLEKKGYQDVIDEGAEHLWDGIKEYFFGTGPKPTITKDEKFAAHLIGIRLDKIARLRGIDTKDKNNKWEDYIITSDFKTVEKKFLDQGIPKEEVKEYLGAFRELRNKHRIHKENEKNIDFWGKQEWDDFKNFVDDLRTTKSISEERKLQKMAGAELLAENKLWSVYHITTHAASQIYGAGTKWCITEKSPSSWNNYSKVNNVYFIISKVRDAKNPWYKIALLVDTEGTETYWDSLDNSYDYSPQGENFNIPKFETHAKSIERGDLQNLYRTVMHLEYHFAVSQLLDDLIHKKKLGSFSDEQLKNIPYDSLPERLEFYKSARDYHQDKLDVYYEEIGNAVVHEKLSDAVKEYFDYTGKPLINEKDIILHGEPKSPNWPIWNQNLEDFLFKKLSKAD